MTIKVFEAHLPRTAAIAPYLRAIDRARRYTNSGPLLADFEARLAERYGLSATGVAGVANATLGLTLALRASGVGTGGLAMMPAWTFAATAHAALAAGLNPWFVDVDPESWSLTPEAAGDALASAPGPVDAVIPVAPFGAPVDVAAWDRFRAKSDIPVVIDAAAGFDSLTPGHVPAVVSLHATKVLGIGEGGFVATRDRALADAVRRLANFGFRGARTAGMPAFNAKLSEYAAAIGLAGLDAWPRIRARFAALARRYAAALKPLAEVRPMPGFGTGAWVASTAVVALPGRDSDAVGAALARRGIETRHWWGEGCHAQPAFARCPRMPLPVTARLAHETLGLPFHPGLRQVDVARIAATLAGALKTECEPAAAAA